MSRPTPWRVRVKLLSESWVEVQAMTAREAEDTAHYVPNVVSVFRQSAIPGDKLAVQHQPVGVEDTEE